MREDAEAVLRRAMADDRLPHGILLYGETMGALEQACLRLSARLLETDELNVATHPDFHALRPANKMRRIKVEDTREIVRQVQHSTVAGGGKVVVVYEADRMNGDSANTFLKTLEEPPAGCTLFLLSTRPTSLMDTVRSRCLQFKVENSEISVAEDEDWNKWLAMLRGWIEMARGALGAERVAELVFVLYGLASQFETLLRTAGATEWQRVAGTLPDGVDDEQRVAMEAGVLKGLRLRRLSEMAEQACFICEKEPGAQSVRALAEALQELDRTGGLLEVNLSDSAAVEYVLLRWLRAWSAR